MSQTTSQTVLQTPELLYLILDLLPFQDLHTANRTCTTFRDTISKSTLLSNKFTFATIKTSTQWYAQKPNGGFLHLLQESETERRICPLLTAIEPERSHLFNVFGMFPSQGPVLSFDTAAYFADVETWKHVYLTNPPVKEARIQIEWHMETEEYAGDSSQRACVRSETGITLGMLVNAVLENRRLYPWILHKTGGGKDLRIEGETIRETLANVKGTVGVEAEARNGWVMFNQSTEPVGLEHWCEECEVVEEKSEENGDDGEQDESESGSSENQGEGIE